MSQVVALHHQLMVTGFEPESGVWIKRFYE